MNKLYKAEVVDNNDTQQQARIQIYIASFMEGWAGDLLPWARPFFNVTGGDFGKTTIGTNCAPKVADPEIDVIGKTFTFGECDIPEKETVVWVWFENDEEKKNPYYITGVQLKKSTASRSFNNVVKANLDDVVGKYPDIKFRIDRNGYVKFHSSNLKVIESGEYNSADSYFYHKDDQMLTGVFKQMARILAGKQNIVELSNDEVTNEKYVKLGQIKKASQVSNFLEIITDATSKEVMLGQKATATTDDCYISIKTGPSGKEINVKMKGETIVIKTNPANSLVDIIQQSTGRSAFADGYMTPFGPTVSRIPNGNP